LCIPVAFLVALSIPLYFHCGNISNEEHSTLTWVQQFLGATFGFSTAFKLWNVAFSQYPEGADATVEVFINWFLLLPEPEFCKGKTRTLLTAKIRGHIVKVLIHLSVLCVILSILRTSLTDKSTDSKLLVRLLRLLPTKGETLCEEAWNGWIHVALFLGVYTT
jgi:hypothetical protein